MLYHKALVAVAAAIILLVVPPTHADACSDGSDACMAGEDPERELGVGFEAFGMLQTQVKSGTKVQDVGSGPFSVGGERELRAPKLWNPKPDQGSTAELLPPGPYGLPSWPVTSRGLFPWSQFINGSFGHINSNLVGEHASGFGKVLGGMDGVEHKYLVPGIAVGGLVFATILLVVGYRAMATLDESDSQKAEDVQEVTGDPKAGADDASSTTGSESGGSKAADKPKASDDMVAFVGLFRFATLTDGALLLAAHICSSIHGVVVPLAYVSMRDALKVLQLPNDDGTIPPAHGPHSIRDDEVMNIFMMYAKLGILCFFVRTAAWQFGAYTAERQYVAVKKALYLRLMRLGPAWYDTHSVSDVTKILAEDTYEFKQGIGEELIDMTRSVVMIVTGIIVCFRLNWRAAMILLCVMPMNAVSMGLGAKVFLKGSMVARKNYMDAGKVVDQCFSTPRTVTAFNGQQRALALFKPFLDKGAKLMIMCTALEGNFMLIRTMATNTALGLAIYYQSALVSEELQSGCWENDPPFGTCSGGSSIFSIFFTLNLAMNTGLGGLTRGIERITKARLSATSMFKLLDQEREPQTAGDKLSDVKGNILYKCVIFSYPSQLHLRALNDVTIEVKAGTSVAFVGPSGSGKSTLVSLLLRFYDPQSGQVLLDGMDVKEMDLTWLRSKMSLVEQEPVLFAGTISENIRNGADARVNMDAVVRAAHLANAHEFITTFPTGYDTELGEKGARLSGGQKQRIAIARALIRDPSVLLLDEATSALDAKSELMVQKTLDRLIGHGGRTTIIIAHRLSTVRNANRICVLRDGHLIEDGTPAELAADPSSAYSQLVALQTSEGLSEIPAVPMSGDKGDTPSSLALSGESQALSGVDNKTADAKANTDANIKTAADAKKESVSNAAGEKMEVISNEENMKPVPISRLWKYTAPDLAWYILGIGLQIVSTVAMPLNIIAISTSVALMDKPAVAYEPESQTWVPIYDTADLINKVGIGALIVIAAGAVSGCTMMATVVSFTKASENLTRRLREILFAATLNQNIEWFDQQSAGFLADRVSQDPPMIKYLTGDNLAAITMLTLTLVFVTFIAVIVCWQYLLTALAAVALPIIGQFAFVAFATRANVDLTSGLVLESLTSLRTVAAFSLDPRLAGKFNRLVKDQASKNLKGSFMMALGMAANAAGYTMLMGLLMFFANIFISKGMMLPDAASMVLLTLWNAVIGIATAGRFFGDKEVAMKAATRVLAIVDRKPPIDSASTSGIRRNQMKGYVDFQDVSFTYSGQDSKVLNKFCLTVEAGSTTALVGFSGCGKSSTLGLLVRFYDPQEGTISIDGADIRRLNLQWLRGKMALVQQEPVLFAGSILDNIRYGKPDAPLSRVQEAAKQAQAHDDFIIKLANGYDTEAGGRVAQLSGGQKQRVAIARALVRDPNLLLLDEATSALDATSESRVMNALNEISSKRSMTMMVVAHRLCTVQTADQICVMSDGVLVEKGTHESLLQRPNGHYTNLVAMQQGGACGHGAATGYGGKGGETAATRSPEHATKSESDEV